MAAAIYIGTQGWNYEGWLGSFYPRKTSAKEMLALYGKIFNTVEIDSTFYAIPPESSVKGWYEKTPPTFRFSVKLPSEITHKNRLRDSEEYLTLFLQRMDLLKEKLGSILIQLPPDFSPAEHRPLQNFLKQLPDGYHFAVEFRDAKWFKESIVAELEDRGVALALIDGKWVDRQIIFRLVGNLRSPFAYVRWLGPRELTDFSRIQIDRTNELADWQKTFQVIAEKTEVIYGYFNNHFQGHSPASSNEFKKLLDLQVVDPATLIIQPSLF